MSVTLTPVGDTLEVDIIDDNFAAIESYFRSSLADTDFETQFSKFNIRRYVGGQLVAVTSLSRTTPYLNQENQGMGTLDAVYRYGSATSPIDGACNGIDYTRDGGVDHVKDWSSLGREVLGRPGPSFIYQWQEDGISEASVLAACPLGWPPSGWQSSPGPDGWCLSPWLTVPNASLRVYVPEKCVANIVASARGALGFSAVGKEICFPDFMADPLDQCYSVGFIDSQTHFREHMLFRFGIVVDTNPELHEDEFVNSNPNIDSATVSWVVLEDKAFYASQRQSFTLDSEVALVGGRWYNFRFVFRDGAIRGHQASILVAGPADEPGHWSSGSWFEDGHYDNMLPTLNPSWDAAYTTNRYGWPHAPGLILWEIAEIQVEFHYGRNEANVADSEDSEFGVR